MEKIVFILNEESIYKNVKAVENRERKIILYR